MMKMEKIVHALAKNSPTLLTGLSVAGLVTTPVLAVRATPKALEIITNERLERADKDKKFIYGSTPIPKMEILKLTWKCYVSSAIMGGLTIACIIGAHALHLRKQAALAGACSLTVTALREYQAKVIETIGENKAREIKEEMYKDKLRNDPVGSKEVLIAGQGEMLCYDVLSGRYFKSDIETVRKAQNDLNRDLMNEMWVDLNAVYDALGLPPTRLGAELGWSVNDSLIEFKFSTQIADNGAPCLVIDYEVTPGQDYQGR